MLAPIKTEPAHVALDCVDIFLLFPGRVGVIETQVATAAEFLCDPEIEGRSIWHVRYGDNRSVRVETRVYDALDGGRESILSLTISRIKSRLAPAGAFRLMSCRTALFFEFAFARTAMARRLCAKSRPAPQGGNFWLDEKIFFFLGGGGGGR